MPRRLRRSLRASRVTPRAARVLRGVRASLALLVACAVVACALGGSGARLARVVHAAQLTARVAAARPTTRASHAVRIDALASAPSKLRAGATARAPFEPWPALVAAAAPRVGPAVASATLARIELAPSHAEAHPHLARARAPPRARA